MSDLQFMLHHVEGVVREVDLLYAVDDLLLCLGVDGLLPQLPQLLLKEAGTESDRKRGRIKICGWSKLYQTKWGKTENFIISQLMKTTNKHIKTEKETHKAQKVSNARRKNYKGGGWD